MTDSDIDFFRALATGGQYEPTTRPVVAAHDSVTAALISKPKLIVITLDAAGTPRAAVNYRKSGMFSLADRSAAALRLLHARLCGFFAGTGIDRLFLRTSSDGGTHAQHPWHSKIEAALQLADRLDVTLVNAQSIRAWVNREEPELPRFVPLEPGARWAPPQEKCLETALFVAANANEHRFFSDGSAHNG